MKTPWRSLPVNFEPEIMIKLVKEKSYIKVDSAETLLREQAFSIQFDGDHVVLMFHIPNISAYITNERIKDKVNKGILQVLGKRVIAGMGYVEDRATRSFTFEQRFDSHGKSGFIFS